MMSENLFMILLYAWAGVGVITFLALFFVNAPYGRHTRKGWGPTVSGTVGWFVMEAPAPILMLLFFIFGDNPRTAASIALLALWELHYVHRAFIFPFRRKAGNKPMPAMIMLFALCFNLVNGSFQGGWVFHFAPAYTAEWLSDPRFIIGALMFLTGFAINQHSDAVLFALRKPGETGYKIPHGGMYRFISAPNYFGEILEWIGWAVATWSVPGLVFALWTAANLAPRAKSNHDWYRETFSDYPKQRKALIPFVW